MTHPAPVDGEPARVLRAVAGLLHEATQQLRQRAATDGAPPQTCLSALGAQLTFAQASALLTTPPFYGIPDQTEADPLTLTQDAERLLRTVPIEALPIGASSLVIAVCDLVRELRAAQG